MFYGWPVPNQSTLLAFKLLEFDTISGALYLQSNNHQIAPRKVMQMTCDRGHRFPAENCTCGLITSRKLNWADDFINLPNLTSLMFSPNRIVVVGVMQVLGNTLVWGDALRSWGLFLWGIIVPKCLEEDYFLDEKFTPFSEINPVVYFGEDGVFEAKRAVGMSQISYGVAFDEEDYDA